MDWKQDFEDVSRTALAAVGEAPTLDALEAARLSLLGRKGRLTALLKGLRGLTIEEKREFGPKANGLKQKVQAAIDARKAELGRAETEDRIAGTRIDVSLPGDSVHRGRLHPITLTIREMAAALSQLGFAWAEGPQVESDYHNFDALNIPADHPARDAWDTLFVDGMDKSSKTRRLLRTHTSPVQIRYMEKHSPPIRIVSPGRVFRHEAVDAGHSAVFYQIEGLYVDRGVTMADLKGTLDNFMKIYFGPKVKTRFRPSFFPFTEPSAEVDVSCLLCGAKGCAACKQSGWMEMLGSGMVHPNVLRNVGYDPEVWSGYAWGLGVERFAMQRLGIPDIRMFYENDVRFLEQFR